MLYGVKFGAGADQFDTLTKYGLALMANLSIEAPELKSVFVDVPAADGSLNLSYALTGSPIYKRRKITFGLVSVKNVTTGAVGAVDEQKMAEIVSGFMADVHGRETRVYLPNDPTSYWTGVVSVGGRSGFNSGILSVTVNAEPYKTTSGGTKKL